MDITESLAKLEGRITIEETPIGVKLAAETPIHDDDYQPTSEGLDAQQRIFDDYEDDVVAVYEAVEEYDGDRMRWEVGRILDEADVERLDAVVARVDKGLDLSEEDCEECRTVFAEHDQPPEER